MKYTLLETAFAALLHDIGKFYQRTKTKSDLNEEELKVAPWAKNGAYQTHLHSGYTSRFFQKYLCLNSEYEMLTSGHHLKDEDEFSKVIRRADQIASAIDRNDEVFDYTEKNNTRSFQRVRLSSILGEIDFGKKRKASIFSLQPLSELGYPKEMEYLASKEECINEYSDLFAQFIEDFSQNSSFSGEIDRYAYDRMYSLLYEYTTSVPASTYEGNKTFVSLFDHSKLSSAIASCLYFTKEKEEPFCLLEFDISGIQKFIFKITESSETKKDVAKSLRGRSLFLSLLTEMITYHYLDEFELTQSNVIFHTGGGALLLLPTCDGYEEKIKKVNELMTKALFEYFGTDITYVSSYVTCNEKELEEFKKEKAIELKCNLEKEKSHKFVNILEPSFFYTNTEEENICKMCGSNFVSKEEELCPICMKIKELSDYFVKHKNMYLVFLSNTEADQIADEQVKISLGKLTLVVIDESELPLFIKQYRYIESFNHSAVGGSRQVANLVPIKNGNVLSFEDICTQLIDDRYGDKKLGILKMDVDNLGAIFAFGLGNSRALSKFLTLSRCIELFFSHYLIEICKEVSQKVNHKINEKTDNGTMFYINYAGGDDLVIVGPAAAILVLANEIHTRFNEFTKNENLTISGGIHIQSPKSPIRFGIQQAEEFLTNSKSVKGKNSITIMDTTIKLSEFDLFLNDVSMLKEMIDQNDISRSHFYSLMKIIDTVHMNQYYKAVPRMLYSVKRNIKKVEKQMILIEYISNIKTLEQLKRMSVIMKLALMQTRG